MEGIFRIDASNELRFAYPPQAEAPSAEEMKPILERARMTGQSTFKVIARYGDVRDLLVIVKPVYTVQGEVRLHPTNKFSGLIIFTTSRSERIVPARMP